MVVIVCTIGWNLQAANITPPDLMAIELPTSGQTTIADSATPMKELLASVTSGVGPVTHDRVGYTFPIGKTLVTFTDGVNTLPAYVYVYPYGQEPIGVTLHENATAANKSASAVRDSNGIIHVAWYDRRLADGVNWVMYRRGTQDSTTGDITWLIPPTRISDAANESPDRNFVALAASDTAVYFAWYRGANPTSNNAVLRLDTSTMTFGPIVDTGCPGRFSSTGCDLAVSSGVGVNGKDVVCILTPGLGKFAISKADGAAGTWTNEDVASMPAGRSWKMGALALDKWGNAHVAYTAGVRGALSGTYSETSGNSAFWELRYARRNITTGSWEDDQYVLDQFAPDWQDPQAVGNPRADTDDILSDWPDIQIDQTDTGNHIHIAWHGSQNTGIYGNDEAFFIRRQATGVNSWSSSWDSYTSLKTIIPPKGFSWAPSIAAEGNSNLALPVVFYNFDPNTALNGADNMIFDTFVQPIRNGVKEGAAVQLSDFAQFGCAGWFPSVNPKIHRHANGKAWLDIVRCDKTESADSSNYIIVFQRHEVSDLLYPLITTQPTDQTVLVGNTATFTAAVNGINLSYQWQKNGVDIAGANATSYTTGTTTLGESGDVYTLKTTNLVGSHTTQLAHLYVVPTPNQAPTITTNVSASPNPVVNAALSALSVVANDPDSGPAALTYSWTQTAGPLSGVTFSPNGSTDADNTTASFLYNGTYTLQVTVSDGADTVTDSLTLNVTLQASGSTTVQLQDGLSSYAGTEDTYLDAFNPTNNNGNLDRLEVRWYTGGTVENDTTLLKFDLTSIPTTATVTNATLDLWVTRTNSVSGVDQLVMMKNTSSWTEATTYNDGIPTSVASGITPPTLGGLPGAQDPVNPAIQYTIPSLTALVQGWVGTPSSNNGLQFTCASDINLRFASSEFGTQAERPMLTVTYTSGSILGPTVIGQPEPVTVTASQTATFGVVVTGTAPFTYQWYKNGVLIGGATASAYTTPATALGDDGAVFTVMVSNSQGGVTSNGATLTVNPVPNVAPVITTAAAATPNPVVSATIAAVSVVANDPDSGPSALTFTWSKIIGPGAVSFTPNGTLAAANSTATFGAAGTYTLQVDVFDGTDTVSSQIVGLVVTLPNTAPTVANAAAASPNPVTGTTTALSVLGADDAGEPALTYAWSATGPASVTYSANGTNGAKTSTATFTKAGSYAITATISDGSLSTTSVVNVTVNQTLTTITVTPASPSVQVSTTQNFSAAGSDQFGDAMTISPAVAWTVSGGGSIDGSTGLFTAGSTPGGPFTVTATSGIAGTALVTVTSAPNAAPTVATAAAGAPNPVTGTTTALTVLGADDGGEPALIYTWSATGPASVTYSANGTNGAKASTATFTQAGTYTITATISDGSLSVTSPVTVTVNQTLTSITVTPAAPSVTVSTTQNFTAAGVDQFGDMMTLAPAANWTVSGGGSIGASSGVFTAGSTAGGPFTVTATSGIVSGTASVTVTSAPNAAPTVATAAAAVPSPVTGTTTALSVLGADDGGEPALTYTWSATGPATVTYSANATNGAKTSTATFTQAGSYVITATISDGLLSTISVINVTVNQTLTTITVTPGTLSMAAGGTQNFTAAAKDQFGAVMISAPTISWSLSDGGTIGSATGIYTAENYPGGPYIVTAQSGAVSGTASVTLTGGNNPVSISIGTISLAGTVGSTTPVNQTITLTNNSSSAVNISTASNQSWFTATPPGPIAIPAHGTLSVTVTADPTSLNGTYNATLTITPSAGSPVTIPVTFTVSTATSATGKRGKGCAISSAADTSSLAWLCLIFTALIGHLVVAGQRCRLPKDAKSAKECKTAG